jgi:ABC-type cobalamin/Fe3+-siderophores transport system ATPase subunit
MPSYVWNCGPIKSLHQRFNTTMIYVTHDQVEAMTLADQIVVMRDGVIVQQGRRWRYTIALQHLRGAFYRLPADESAGGDSAARWSARRAVRRTVAGPA